jgi:3-keto-5-aminohexanoate cleavage enzyme
MSDKVVITCALTGVLTDPRQHPVPVTPEQMAREAKAAFDAGAAVMHVQFRQQAPGKGHLPSWQPELAVAIMQAIRDACPGVILNESTGTMGPDISGPLACLRAVKPEIAACNAGSLNYLKVRADGSWAWPPHLFDNPVEKVKAYLEVMAKTGTQPEFECFDLGIVRCVGMYARNGMFTGVPKYNFVMGVESGMPADPDLLPILHKLVIAGAPWQVTAVGRETIWPLHRRAAELGGHLRTGLEDTFYLPDGGKAHSNGVLVDMLARYARDAGRVVASPSEARSLMALAALP